MRGAALAGWPGNTPMGVGRGEESRIVVPASMLRGRISEPVGLGSFHPAIYASIQAHAVARMDELSSRPSSTPARRPLSLLYSSIILTLSGWFRAAEK
ncbi:hypothetical protein [Methylomonas fluvii]|uniref:hypothetical protein n=1 Tax=Methylomonas fluvii TaxID=1854564 RepID=UPI001E3C6B0E|nr:hypothetical protein [Methylomonas fluvii]